MLFTVILFLFNILTFNKLINIYFFIQILIKMIIKIYTNLQLKIFLIFIFSFFYFF